MFNYNWSFKDYPAKHNLKVFSTFACGGGSTMGYKLAGYDVIGCNEIDPKLIEIYKKNHNPKYCYLEDIRIFKNRTDLPKELYELDILDGSPPCSTFSLAGQREESWGKQKIFREGQAMQTLDDLFFDFIDLTAKLQPKVFIAENVKGLLVGNAIKYVQKIIKGFEKAGYEVEYWLLNGADMGVPQARERVFFIGIRKDLCLKITGTRQTLFSKMPALILNFNERPIKFGEFRDSEGIDKTHTQRGQLMLQRIPSDRTVSDINMRLYEKNSGFNDIIVHDEDVCATIPSASYHWRYFDGKVFTDHDLILASSFPLDYDFLDTSVKYVVGMSVPPLMIAQISNRIKLQWFDKLKES